MADKPKLSPHKQLYLLTFAHAVVDTYAAALPHLLPLLLKKLVSETASWNRLVGRLIAVSGVFNSLSQVIFGQLADRAKTVHFLTFGVGLPAVCTSLLGDVPSVLLLMLLLVIGGMGVAAFHPQAVAQAAALARRGRGFGVSLFITGGNVGQAVGPFCIMLLLGDRVLERLTWCMIPGLGISLLVAKTLRPQPIEGIVETPGGESSPVVLAAKKEGPWQTRRTRLRTLIVLYLITTLRAVTTVGLLNFLSLRLDELQYSNLGRSAILALFVFAGSMGIITGGSLSDRMNRYSLLLFSLIAAPPLLYTALHTTGIRFLILLFTGNLILSSSITINITLAQELLPGRENLASSLMMGAAWGVAGLLTYPVGMIADRIGLAKVLDRLVMLPLVTSILVLFLERKKGTPTS